MERSNLRRVLVTPVLMLTSLSVSLVLGKVVLRARSWFVRSEPPRARGGIKGLPALSGVTQLSGPDTRGIYKGQTHRANRFGFRRPERIVDKPADVSRIVVTGDSLEPEENFAGSAPAWLGFQPDLRRIADVGADLDVCVVMLIHTHASRLDDLHPLESFFGRMAAAGQRLALFPVSSLAFSLGLDAARPTIGPPDSYPNAEGHRLASEALAAGLLALPWRRSRGVVLLGFEATHAVQ